MDNALEKLYQVVLARKGENMEGSYTCYLFQQGLDKILKKLGEESAETIIASKNGDPAALIGEICDLLYHLTVLMAEKGVELEDVFLELDRRAEKVGNLKQLKSVDKES